jgi:LysR family transcriptional regulator for bpeEF and oprC
VVPKLGDFLKRYPEIELEVGCTDRQVDLLLEGVDCVIRGGHLTATLDESLVARRLGSIKLVTCASPDYLREHGTPVTLADLARHRIVNYASPQSGKVYGFEYLENDAKVTIHGKRCITINDTDACVEAALAGIGLVQVPEFSITNYVIAGKLQRVLEDQPLELLPLSILYPQNRHLSSKVRAFVEWAAELFAPPA